MPIDRFTSEDDFDREDVKVAEDTKVQHKAGGRAAPADAGAQSRKRPVPGAAEPVKATRRSSARKTASRRAGRTAQSKEAAIKALALEAVHKPAAGARARADGKATLNALKRSSHLKRSSQKAATTKRTRSSIMTARSSQSSAMCPALP